MSYQRILVTGAASGIGQAVALTAVARGLDVFAVDRDVDALHRMQTESAVLHCAADVTDEQSVAEAFDRSVQVWGRAPDAVVHAAGQYEIDDAAELGPDDWNRVFTVNATGSFLVARSFGRSVLASSTRGSLVLISSIAAKRGDGEEPAAHYCASKAAIEALTRQLAVEWGPRGVRVNCVSPGLIATPMLRVQDDPERAHAATGRLPLRRIGEPDEVAHACLFLAGAEASYISGVTLTVDGGLTAQ